MPSTVIAGNRPCNATCIQAWRQLPEWNPVQATPLIKRARYGRLTKYPLPSYVHLAFHNSVLLMIAALPMLTSCEAPAPANQQQNVSNSERQMTNAPVTSIEQAIALAELEVHKLGWKKNEYEVTSSGSQGDVWWVEIWRIPKVPGGYVIVEITSGGKVTVLPGL